MFPNSMQSRPHHGLLVLDKPLGRTSRVMLNEVQRLLPRKTKIGHAGTLDPLATGVLVVGIGKATRLIEYIQDMDKVYFSDFLLGHVSSTDDGEGVIEPVTNYTPPDQERVRHALASFLGPISQIPPRYSASKINGKRAYDLARSGKEIILESRLVSIYDLEILHYEFPILRLQIRCSKGTYIRSLARDLGEYLGCGGMVQSLRRTRVGPFSQEMAMQIGTMGLQPSDLLPLDRAVANLPRLQISKTEMARLSNGLEIERGELLIDNPSHEDKEMAIYLENQLVGIGTLGECGKTLAPRKMLTGLELNPGNN